MNKKNYGLNIFAKVKRVWIYWDDHYIADTYEDAIDYSIKNGMIDSFNDWLDYNYTHEETFKLTEDEKVKVKTEYIEYVKGNIADVWEEREIVF